MNKISEKVKWREKWFQVLLLFLGFSLGFGSTYYWQIRQEKNERLAIATILKYTADQEIVLAKGFNQVLKDYIDKRKEGRLWLGNFKLLYDPRIYSEIRSSITKLEPEIIKAVSLFDLILQQCQQSHNICQESLNISNGRVYQDEYSGLEAYSYGLQKLIEAGESLLCTIDKYFHNIKTPKIELLLNYNGPSVYFNPPLEERVNRAAHEALKFFPEEVVAKYGEEKLIEDLEKLIILWMPQLRELSKELKSQSEEKEQE